MITALEKMEINKEKKEEETPITADTTALETGTKRLEKLQKQGTLFANEQLPEMLQVAKSYLDSSQDTETIITPERVSEAIRYGKYRIEETKHKGTKRERELGLEMIQEVDTEKMRHLPAEEVSSYFAEQFATFIKVISEPLSKKYYLALWKLAGKRGMPIFSGQKLSDLIKEATGKTNKQIRQRDRQLATKCLLAWNRIQLKVLTDIKSKPFYRGNKKLWKIERSYQYTKLFNLIRGVEEEVIDKDGKIIETATIKHIFGNLPFETQSIGAYIPENILLLTGDEGERIDLALEIWKRANQLSKSRFLQGGGEDKKYSTPDFSKKTISWTRSEWIKKAGKSKTDKVNKALASDYLLADFKRLKELGIIENYPNEISTSDNEIITITLKELKQPSE